ncbi:hypothetical protein HXX76_008428 [Chlamydomonas incerta]|uniref:Uncharacterized protein n=1 Tax=Chlamydomonas incerta TaxID=51695 RepID=A0A835SXN0_CHLIN|nr:hypothetical protein HXX76_008428 [Chlamydomonas incerta]|eukprot:KAG2433367.1 hypothetical protein HXX76_008428 [Chlamydomonas incerta]
MSELAAETTSWSSLSCDVKLKVAGYLHPNDAAANLKIVDSETAKALRGTFSIITITLGKLQEEDSFNPFKPIRAPHAWPGHLFAAHWGCPEPWRVLTLPQRERLLCLAAASCHAGSLDAALAHCGCALKPEVLAAAAVAGNLAGCEQLQRAGLPLSDLSAPTQPSRTAAAESGQLPRMEEHGCWTPETRCFRNIAAAAAGACAGGQLQLLLECSPLGPDGQWRRGADLPMLLAPWVELAEAVAAGCPLAVLQRHYDDYPWAWARPAAGGATEPRRGARPAVLLGLLAAAAGSGTACWPDKPYGSLCLSYGSVVLQLCFSCVPQAQSGFSQVGSVASKRTR